MENIRKFIIMMKDTEVMEVDFDAMQYTVNQEDLLPYPIKGKLREMPRNDKSMSVCVLA